MKQITAFPAFVEMCDEIDLPIPGARGWMISGKGQQVVFAEFEQTVDVPDHQHSEQWEHAIAGQVDLKRNGTVESYTAGENFFIPAGQPHGATVHAGYKAIIIFNEPDRYKPKSS